MNLQIKLVKHLTKAQSLGYLAARDTDAEKTVFVADCLVSEHLYKLYEMQFCQIIKKNKNNNPHKNRVYYKYKSGIFNIDQTNKIKMRRQFVLG